MLLMVGVSLVEMMALHLAGWRLFKARTIWLFCVLYIAQHRAESDGYCIGFLIAAYGWHREQKAASLQVGRVYAWRRK